MIDLYSSAGTRGFGREQISLFHWSRGTCMGLSSQWFRRLEVISGISVSSLNLVSGRVNSTPPRESRDWQSGSMGILACVILQVLYEKVCEGRRGLYCAGIFTLYHGPRRNARMSGSALPSARPKSNEAPLSKD